mgnify:CR=1 FL=1
MDLHRSLNRCHHGKARVGLLRIINLACAHLDERTAPEIGIGSQSSEVIGGIVLLFEQIFKRGYNLLDVIGYGIQVAPPVENQRYEAIEPIILGEGTRRLPGLPHDLEKYGRELMVIEASRPLAELGFDGDDVGTRSPEPGISLGCMDELLLDQVVKIGRNFPSTPT